MDPKNQEMLESMLGPLREAARERVRAFAEEPLGRFVRIAGQRMMQAKVEGRTANLYDLQAVVDEAIRVDEEKKGPKP